MEMPVISKYFFIDIYKKFANFFSQICNGNAPTEGLFTLAKFIVKLAN